MKKITYFMFMILGMVLMVGNVDAANYKADTDWSIEGEDIEDICGNFTSELENARTEFSFDSSTGKFSVSGKSYQDFVKTAGGKQQQFFAPSEDGRTLYGYFLSFNNWTIPYPEDWGKVPAYDCADTLKVVKTSYALSEEDPGDEPSDDPSDDDPISDPDDDTDNSSNGIKTTKKTKTYTTSGGTQQTTNNPNTGISPFLSLPAILGGGIAIVLRKKRIFG